MGYLLYFITFIISSVPALFLSAPPVEDALGTMGAAAYLAGYDFRDFLASDGYFYKYGQSLFYLPVCLCIKDPALRYKLMLVVNSAIDAFIPVIAYRIATRHLDLQKREAFGLALLAGLMPSALLYTKYTWAEPSLFIVPWIIMYILPELGKTDLKRQKVLSALLAFSSVWAFMVHQRGIVVVIAVFLMALFCRGSGEKKLIHLPSYLAALAAGIALDRALNYWQRQVVYLGVKPKYNTLSAFLHPEIYRKLFSPDGIRTVGVTLMGWLFNTAVSGLGITLLGILFAVVVFRRRSPGPAIKLISTYGLLSFLGALALGMLFFFEELYGYLGGEYMRRCDHLVFGRYLESSYPVLFFTGAYMLLAADKPLIKKLCAGTVLIMTVLLGFYALRIAPLMEGIDSYVHSLMSMNYSFNPEGVTVTRDTISNLPSALILSGVIAIALFVIMALLMYRNSHFVPFMLCAMVFVYIFIHSFIDIIYRVDHLGLTQYASVYLRYGTMN